MTLGLRLSAKNGPQSMFSRITAPRPSNHATMSGSRRGSNASQSSIRHVFSGGGLTHTGGGHGTSASASGSANHVAGYVSIQGLSQGLGHGNSQRQNPVSAIKETEVDRRLSAIARAKAGPLRAPSARGLNVPSSSTTTNTTSSLLNSSRYDIHLTYTFLLYLVMYTFLLSCCYVLATCSFHV